jgi:hypothetical protein
MKFVIHVECAGSHEQRMTVEAASLDSAHRIAALLDGTSRLYVKPPPARIPEGIIGRCGICCRPIKCRVEGTGPQA